MARRIVACCKNCGKENRRNARIKRDGSFSEDLYCNKACYDEYRRAVIRAREVSCAHCGSAFSVAPSQARSYCSWACVAAARKAKPNHCLSCGCLFTPVKWHAGAGRMISHNSGKTCSPGCASDWNSKNPERKRKISEAFRGHLHPNWQGGKALLNNASNRGPNWSKQRAAAIKRDGACVDCGISNDDCLVRYRRSLDVDHVVPFHNFSNYRKANALSNLQCRCASCHRIAEAKRSMIQMVLPVQDSESRRHKGRIGKGNHRLTEQQVLAIRARSDAGEPATRISIDFPLVSRRAVSDVAKRRSWSHIP